MSDISGTGWGSDHDWERGETNQVGSTYWLKGTHYYCRNCGIHFEHKYDLIPNIFEAMKQADIPEKCSRKKI